MRGSKILITGPTGQVAAPIARALAADNEVWGIARFRDPAARDDLEQAGVRCETVNLAAGDFTGVPTDFDYVLNLAVAKSGNWDKDLAANAESVGLLMAHCRGARPSCTARRPPSTTRRTTNPGPSAPPSATTTSSLFPDLLHLQDRRRGRRADDGARARRAHHHRPAQRPLRRQRRLAVLPHGDDAGRHADPGPARRPARYNPIHEDDIIATLPKLLDAASVPATTVNWGGDQTVSLQEWCAYIGSLVGRNRCSRRARRPCAAVPPT